MAHSCLLDRGRVHGRPGSDPANRLQSRVFSNFPRPEGSDGQVTYNPVLRAIRYAGGLLVGVITPKLRTIRESVRSLNVRVRLFTSSVRLARLRKSSKAWD